MRCLMKGVEDLSKAYVAQPKDNTLPSLLHEAFILLEIRFANFGPAPIGKRDGIQATHRGC